MRLSTRSKISNNCNKASAVAAAVVKGEEITGDAVIGAIEVDAVVGAGAEDAEVENKPNIKHSPDPMACSQDQSYLLRRLGRPLSRMVHMVNHCLA